MVNRDVEFIATHEWHHRMSDGSIISWHQEDESAAKSKEEAVGIVQRTLDFWTTKLASDIAEKREVSVLDAEVQAMDHVRGSIASMLDKPFPMKWGMTIDDFTVKVLTCGPVQ